MIRGGVLRISSEVRLASALLVHPEIDNLCFIQVEIEEFSAITLALQQTDRLIQLELEVGT